MYERPAPRSIWIIVRRGSPLFGAGLLTPPTQRPQVSPTTRALRAHFHNPCKSSRCRRYVSNLALPVGDPIRHAEEAENISPP